MSVEVALTVDHGGLVDYFDGREAAGPDVVLPVMETSDLPGEVRIDIVHQPGQLAGREYGEKHVVVVRQEHEGVQENVRMAPKGATEDAEYYLV